MNSLAAKKILVTGGAGYIGSHTIVELLNAGYEPVIVDDYSNSDPKVIERLETVCGRKIKAYAVDCTDKARMRDVFLNEGDFFGVIHFAAFKAVEDSVHNPLKYYRNNLGSLVTVLELMDQFSVHNLVFSSSCSVYGDTGTEPVREDMPVTTPKSPYGYTKQVCEQIIADAVGCGQQIRSASLRYFNPIGAHPSGLIGELPINKPSNLIPFLTQTAAGIRKELVVFGGDYSTDDGTAVRDFIHVCDLARAHVAALDWLDRSSEEHAFNEIFNVGTGHGHTVLEVINTFEKRTQVSVNYRVGDRRSGDVEAIFAQISKANDLLRWKPEKTLADALQDAWNWQLRLESDPSNPISIRA